MKINGEYPNAPIYALIDFNKFMSEIIRYGKKYGRINTKHAVSILEGCILKKARVKEANDAISKEMQQRER